MSFKTYFTAQHILSKGALFNCVLSDRSDGKTFDCKVRALLAYKSNKNITVYLRRFKSEITANLYENFFNDVLGDNRPEKEKYRKEFVGWQFKGTRRGVQVKLPGTDEWDWIVFFVPLTMSGKLKSQLDGFIQRISIVNFDEYVPLDGRYAKDEMSMLLEFWKSLDRDRDTLQMLLLGNKITSFTPFFDFFNLSLSITQDKVRLYRNGTLAVQIYSSKEHRTERAKSRFNELVEDTAYEEYNNGGVLNALNLKVASHVGASYFSSFMTEQGEGTIWSNGRHFIISTYKRKDGFVLVDKMYNTGREEYQITYGRFLQLFKRMYKTGQMYFEDEKSYHVFEPILHKFWL